MRFWMALMLGCFAMGGYAQEEASEVVTTEEPASDEAAMTDSRKNEKPKGGGCGCGKPPK